MAGKIVPSVAAFIPIPYEACFNPVRFRLPHGPEIKGNSLVTFGIC